MSILLLFSASNSCNNDSRTEEKKQVISTHIGSIIDQTDAELLVEVAEISLAEIKLGQLAQRNAQAIDIRELGKRMEKAHTAYLETLKDLGKKKLIMLPLSPTQELQKLLEKLEKMPKNAFDKAYCDQTVWAHQQAINRFERIVKSNTDTDIQQCVRITLTGLNAQLAYALMHKRTFDKKKRDVGTKKRGLTQT